MVNLLIGAAGLLRGFSLIRIALMVTFATLFKTLLVGLITVSLGAVLHNFAIEWITEGFNAVSSYLNVDIPPMVLNLTGLSAWWIQKLKLAESVAVVLAGMCIGFVRSIIKL